MLVIERPLSPSPLSLGIGEYLRENQETTKEKKKKKAVFGRSAALQAPKQ